MATLCLPRRLNLWDLCMKKAGISQIKTGGGSQGEVSPLIYILVETCRISPMHFSAMPLLWQPVCKYLLTLTRTKQCHCTSLWFRLHGSAEYVSVRHWDIHGAVVCIPCNRVCMHVRADVQMSCVDFEALLMYCWWLACQTWAQLSVNASIFYLSHEREWKLNHCGFTFHSHLQ